MSLLVLRRAVSQPRRCPCARHLWPLCPARHSLGQNSYHLLPETLTAEPLQMKGPVVGSAGTPKNTRDGKKRTRKNWRQKKRRWEKKPGHKKKRDEKNRKQNSKSAVRSCSPWCASKARDAQSVEVVGRLEVFRLLSLGFRCFEVFREFIFLPDATNPAYFVGVCLDT